MLPSTPTTSAFPSHVRVVRSTGYNEAAVLTTGIAFAKRKKSPFKGPTVTNGSAGKRDGNSAGSRNQERKRSRGNIIEEEDEDVEEVSEFVGPGELDAEEGSDDDDTLRGRHGSSG